MAERRKVRPLRVVVIDDDPDMVKVIRVMLGVTGVEVLEAFSGLKGYSMVKRELPDVVLLDIMMPDIDGFEVLRKIKLDPETHSIPVVFVSARTGREHIERGLSLGAQGYVTKPFKPDELVGQIKKALGASTDLS
jgi:CheY-like chemotaxis protein